LAPVLSPEEAARHPHNVARNVYGECDGMLQANPAPRFAGETLVPGPVPACGQHTDEIMEEAGFTPTDIAALRSAGAIR